MRTLQGEIVTPEQMGETIAELLSAGNIVTVGPEGMDGRQVLAALGNALLNRPQENFKGKLIILADPPMTSAPGGDKIQ